MIADHKEQERILSNQPGQHTIEGDDEMFDELVNILRSKNASGR